MDQEEIPLHDSRGAARDFVMVKAGCLEGRISDCFCMWLYVRCPVPLGATQCRDGFLRRDLAINTYLSI